MNPSAPSENKILNAIKQHISNNYTTCAYGEAKLRLSNVELHALLLKAFPTEDFTAEFLYEFMSNEEFIYYESAPMRFEWCLKKK